MISNKSKAILALGIIMLSNLTITNAESKNLSSEKVGISNNVYFEEVASSDYNLPIEVSTNDNIIVEDTSYIISNNSEISIKENNSSITSSDTEVSIEKNNPSLTSNDTETSIEENNYSTPSNDIEISTEEDTSHIISNDTDIDMAKNTFVCPNLNEAPIFTTSNGFNENGIGDSVYEHLKNIGWTSTDENTISINQGRLQFKNMNGLNNIDSIITIRSDFEENDKYYLYLLKLMIGDKSISTATPSDSEIFSGAFDDTYYDNFENLVRRIANGSGTINYSNRSIRVQYDGKIDYTITLTFSNYKADTTQVSPSIDEDNDNIIYSEVPEI